MKHLGDISRITKEDAVPVDCITFPSMVVVFHPKGE